MRGAQPSAVSSLPEVWRAAPRRWGHRWHAMCSYMAMFPPTIPRVFIDWLTSKDDVVYDPFCGRGTTVLEACTSGRIGLGSDANPLAWVLTSAKASPPRSSEVERRVGALRANCKFGMGEGEPTEIKALFDPRVLDQLVWLKSQLSPGNAVDRFLLAVLTGILHANSRSDGTSRGLSISMPNTFAMSPAYVLRYKSKHKLKPPKIDVFDVVVQRIESLGKSRLPVRGQAWMQDAAEGIQLPRSVRRPSLVFSSPPYLGVMKYAKLNWIRMWLLGRTVRDVDAKLFSSGSIPKYLDFMTEVLKNLEGILENDGRICLVIGDVKSGTENINLAQRVAEHCVQRAGLMVDATVVDDVPQRHKVSRIWGSRRGHATKTDRILIASRAGTPRLPRIPEMSWR